MRLSAIAAVAAFALMAVTPAAAHEGDHAEHLSIRIDELEAGADRTMFPTYKGGAFAAGWIFFVYGGVQSEEAAMDLELRKPDNETVVASWKWEPGRFHTNSTMLPEATEYILWLNNTHADEALDYAFYFDQSCECLDKTIGLDGGWGIFNLNAQADRKINFTMGVYHVDMQAGGAVDPEGVRVKATAARLVDARAQWPDDFENITSAETDQIKLSMEWETEKEGTQYVWVQVLEGASPQRPVLLFPNIKQEAAGGDAPGPAGLAGLLAVAAALALAGRIRRTP